MSNQSKENLLDKIYITRKARIVSADRLLHLDNSISAINIYYSAILIVFSLCAITNGNETVNISLISASILAFAFNAFAMSRNFKDNYLSYKQNYIALDNLYRQIDIDESIDQKSLIVYNEKYIELLDCCPNHTTLDYYKVIISDKPLIVKKGYSKKKIAWIYITYIWSKIAFAGLIVCSIVAPFVVPMIIGFISRIFLVA